MGALADLLDAPPPPAYETVAKHRVQSSMPGGLDAALWLTILTSLVRPRQDKEQEAMGWADVHRNVRFVCKDLYLVCMHLLRSRYLQRYMSRVRPPFTSDPYPSGQVIPSASAPANPALSPSPSSSNVHRSGQGAGRETRILDLFVAASVRSDIEAFESSLLESTLGDDEEGENDLFAYHQPKARLEDLVIADGYRKRLFRADSRSELANTVVVEVKNPPANAIKAQDAAVELTGRSAALRVRSDQSASRALRTLFEVSRSRGETLESTAHKVIARLQTTLASR